VLAACRRLAVLGTLTLAAASLALPVGALRASSTDAFEVASITLRVGERVIGGNSTPDRFVRPATTLRDLIRCAYNVQDFQIEGGPSWIASNRFDVNVFVVVIESAALPTPD
jgi:hypothetical protein